MYFKTSTETDSIKAIPAVSLNRTSGGIFLVWFYANLLVLFSSCVTNVSADHHESTYSFLIITSFKFWGVCIDCVALWNQQQSSSLRVTSSSCNKHTADRNGSMLVGDMWHAVTPCLTVTCAYQGAEWNNSARRIQQVKIEGEKV